LKKVKGKKGKDPVADLDVEGPESGKDAHRSPRFHLAERKRGLALDSDSESEFEANFKHGGRKRRETVIPMDAIVNLGDDFFDDVHSCSGEPANLEDVCTIPSSFTVIFFYSVALVFDQRRMSPNLPSSFVLFRLGSST